MNDFRALAIAGHKCLFLDSFDRYGGSILNFNLEHYLNYGKREALIPLVQKQIEGLE